MKTLKETYVIVKQFEDSSFDFFQNNVSFDKEELDKKCEELNKEKNDSFEKCSKRNNLPIIPLIIFVVLSLEEAIEKFYNGVADEYTEHDASY